jgi:hypothetical protein
MCAHSAGRRRYAFRCSSHALWVESKGYRWCVFAPSTCRQYRAPAGSGRSTAGRRAQRLVDTTWRPLLPCRHAATALSPPAAAPPSRGQPPALSGAVRNSHRTSTSITLCITSPAHAAGRTAIGRSLSLQLYSCRGPLSENKCSRRRSGRTHLSSSSGRGSCRGSWVLWPASRCQSS